MSVADHSKQRQEQPVETGALHMPGLVTQLSPVEQLAFPEPGASTPPANASQQASFIRESTPVPGTLQNSNGDRLLPDIRPGMMASMPDNSVSKRPPLMIPGDGKKSSPRPPKGRRLIIYIAATAVLAFVVLGTLITVLPAGSDAAHISSTLSTPKSSIIGSQSNNTSLIAAQAATATVVTQDGLDSGDSPVVYSSAGLPTPPPAIMASADGDHFTYGQCTYWASLRYHQLTGKWVPWSGNADEWVSGAYSAGWPVSQTPHVGAIMVLMGGVQGASYSYGHVAVVESIPSPGEVVTSNWNWGNAGWATTSYVTFQTGPGVYFVG